ncbi:DUF2249 domain-containing protein [Blastochloris sulfoviridis]|uniref:DUF2249 domain-containing protein n=1 Tax=Blastochloris sulfoviridis TaxID=50712 RepID=A0A5M6HJF8_9HYPH|nr:DUF2249 domain-containing protein [Blastochloris sulfoviridis]KAA5595980.1 DUF2249 domain-containing protein [Blastochloris sulfoviridis]
MTTATSAIIDVRILPPGTCRNTLVRTLVELEPGAVLTIVNDHDPQPLRAYLDLSHPDQFAWTYLEDGPDVWRVRIERTA